MATKQVGETYTDSCMAEGWPIPSIEWYFNNKSIANLSSQKQQLKYSFTIINHHRHLAISSHLVISNLTESHSGLYSCVVNGKINMRNITILVKSSKSSSSTGL